MTRTLTDKELCHNNLTTDGFSEALSNYDTERRIQVLVHEMLIPIASKTDKIVDVGCGLGFFSNELKSNQFNVIATDIGEDLLNHVSTKYGIETKYADVMDFSNSFPENSVENIISSECIEHTPDPSIALSQMCRAIKSGGHLSISTPNKVWQPIVRLATFLKLRPFDGHENFLSWKEIKNILEESGMEIVTMKGLHLFPFQFGLHKLSTWCDENLQLFKGGMINMCILARKK